MSEVAMSPDETASQRFTTPQGRDPSRAEYKNERRRRILLKNTSIATVGYAFPAVAYFMAKYLGFASYTYGNVGLGSLWIVVSAIVLYTVILKRRIITIRFIDVIAFCEIANWVILYLYIVSFLNEIRLSALLCAFMGIIFLIPNRGFLASLLISTSTAAGYIVISFYQIHYGGQTGTFAVELMYVCFFYFSALFVAWTAKRFSKQREEVIEAKRRAEAANRAKSEFLSNMSHELRTPLNHIIGFTELVADRKVGDINETQKEYLDDALGSSQHLLSLIDDILDLAKIESGKIGLSLEEVNLERLLRESMQMVKEKALKRGIAHSIQTNGIPKTLRVDRRKLKQILYNLLSNALKFTPDGGEVILSAREVDCPVRRGLRKNDPETFRIIKNDVTNHDADEVMRCVEISVTDTGVGIAVENLNRIFKPFEQVDGSISRAYQGTGLGLSIVRQFVEIHGGRVYVESEGTGKGSTFRFLLPVQPL